MSRVWAVNDPIAEHRDDHWRKGTVTDVNRWRVAVRWDDAEHACFRSPTDPHLVAPDEVPIDERHWLPAAVRDQLVGQEAAARLRAMAKRLLPLCSSHIAEFHLARRFDDLIGRPDSDGYAAAARALLGLTPPADRGGRQ